MVAPFLAGCDALGERSMATNVSEDEQVSAGIAREVRTSVAGSLPSELLGFIGWMSKFLPFL
jgi:hypothetical protein